MDVQSTSECKCKCKYICEYKIKRKCNCKCNCKCKRKRMWKCKFECKCKYKCSTKLLAFRPLHKTKPAFRMFLTHKNIMRFVIGDISPRSILRCRTHYTLRTHTTD